MGHSLHGDKSIKTLQLDQKELTLIEFLVPKFAYGMKFKMRIHLKIKYG